MTVTISTGVLMIVQKLHGSNFLNVAYRTCILKKHYWD